MRKVTRRSALKGLSGAGLVGLLGALPSAAVTNEEPVRRRALFVVGPFNLGDWFRKADLRIEGLFNLGAPDRGEIAKSLSECTLYVIDEQVGKDPKKLRFAAGGPKLVATGKLYHLWKDDKKTFAIQISKLKASSDLIDYDAIPPHQRVRISVELITAGTTRKGSSSSTFSLMPKDPLFYDINGKRRRA